MVTKVTKKVRRFQKGDIEGKAVTTLGGIGDTFGERLVDKGYPKAVDVVIKFMKLGQSIRRFGDWFYRKLHRLRVNRKHLNDCLDSIIGWIDKHEDESDRLLRHVRRAEE